MVEENQKKGEEEACPHRLPEWRPQQPWSPHQHQDDSDEEQEEHGEKAEPQQQNDER